MIPPSLFVFLFLFFFLISLSLSLNAITGIGGVRRLALKIHDPFLSPFPIYSFGGLAVFLLQNGIHRPSVHGDQAQGDLLH